MILLTRPEGGLIRRANTGAPVSFIEYYYNKLFIISFLPFLPRKNLQNPTGGPQAAALISLAKGPCLQALHQVHGIEQFYPYAEITYRHGIRCT